MRGRALEPKVAVGIVLMVLATVVGALSMQHATRRTAVWQLGHALAAGSRISAGDVHVAEIAIDQGTTAYATIGMAVVGRVVSRDLAAEELLPLAALRGGPVDHERVTVPVEPMHLPPSLRRGQRVDVWLTPRLPDGVLGETRRVLRRALVDSVDPSDVSGHAGVVLAVPHAEVALLVAALRLGAIDLVGVGGAL